MNIDEIIKFLKEQKMKFTEIKFFSINPGIYAVFYIGDTFKENDIIFKHNEFIYIGKTEMSQLQRDAKIHFRNNKTGSSTLRKSIGVILINKLVLIPITRNKNDYKKGRFSHFKFDSQSEEEITKWMVNNLALSFYEYKGKKKS
ncbi:GIY-YIG nuclease family protein [Calditrichota bacterium LG25]